MEEGSSEELLRAYHLRGALCSVAPVILRDESLEMLKEVSSAPLGALSRDVQ